MRELSRIEEAYYASQDKPEESSAEESDRTLVKWAKDNEPKHEITKAILKNMQDSDRVHKDKGKEMVRIDGKRVEW